MTLSEEGNAYFYLFAAPKYEKKNQPNDDQCNEQSDPATPQHFDNLVKTFFDKVEVHGRLSDRF